MKHEIQPVAIITGAGSGIGRATAVGLRAKGYRVVLVGRRLDALEETGEMLGESRTNWIAIKADIAKNNNHAQIIEQTINCFGRLDAIVNNAGLGTCKLLGDLSQKEILDLFLVNAIGPIAFVGRAIPELVKSKGCVVNVASMAIVDPFVGLGIYGCAKAAIDGLTRSLHNEYGEQGIRAFTIAPGAVETEMLRSIVSTEMLPTEQTLSPEQVAAKIIECIIGEASETSGSTILLQSPS